MLFWSIFALADALRVLAAGRDEMSERAAVILAERLYLCLDRMRMAQGGWSSLCSDAHSIKYRVQSLMTSEELRRAADGWEEEVLHIIAEEICLAFSARAHNARVSFVLRTGHADSLIDIVAPPERILDAVRDYFAEDASRLRKLDWSSIWPSGFVSDAPGAYGYEP